MIGKISDQWVVFVSMPSQESAKTMANELVSQHLAACVSIVPQVQSVYRWQGAVESATEALLVIKTTPEAFLPLQQWVEKHHNYDVPECIALPVVAGLPSYLDWITQQVKAF